MANTRPIPSATLTPTPLPSTDEILAAVRKRANSLTAVLYFLSYPSHLTDKTCQHIFGNAIVVTKDLIRIVLAYCDQTKGDMLLEYEMIRKQKEHAALSKDINQIHQKVKMNRIAGPDLIADDIYYQKKNKLLQEIMASVNPPLALKMHGFYKSFSGVFSKYERTDEDFYHYAIYDSILRNGKATPPHTDALFSFLESQRERIARREGGASIPLLDEIKTLAESTSLVNIVRTPTERLHAILDELKRTANLPHIRSITVNNGILEVQYFREKENVVYTGRSLSNDIHKALHSHFNITIPKEKIDSLFSELPDAHRFPDMIVYVTLPLVLSTQHENIRQFIEKWEASVSKKASSVATTTTPSVTATTEVKAVTSREKQEIAEFLNKVHERPERVGQWEVSHPFNNNEGSSLEEPDDQSRVELFLNGANKRKARLEKNFRHPSACNAAIWEKVTSLKEAGMSDALIAKLRSCVVVRDDPNDNGVNQHIIFDQNVLSELLAVKRAYDLRSTSTSSAIPTVTTNSFLATTTKTSAASQVVSYHP